MDGGRILPKDEYTMPMTAARTKEQQPPQQKREGFGRTQSLRQRLAGHRQASGVQQTSVKDSAGSSQAANSSLRDRRQSSITQGVNVSGPARRWTCGEATAEVYWARLAIEYGQERLVAAATTYYDRLYVQANPCPDQQSQQSTADDDTAFGVSGSRTASCLDLDSYYAISTEQSQEPAASTSRSAGHSKHP